MRTEMRTYEYTCPDGRCVIIGKKRRGSKRRGDFDRRVENKAQYQVLEKKEDETLLLETFSSRDLAMRFAYEYLRTVKSKSIQIFIRPKTNERRYGSKVIETPLASPLDNALAFDRRQVEDRRHGFES